MQLILTGCGYAGKTTLAVEISRWMIREMGEPFVRWHNHFVVPQLDRHLIVEGDLGSGDLPGKQGVDLNVAEDEEQIMGSGRLCWSSYSGTTSGGICTRTCSARAKTT